MTDHLRFGPDVLRRLGEELNPSPEQGILELVRNAYDADAGRCTVRLDDVTKAGGKLTIEDDGVGMTAEQLRSAFLVLGSSVKTSGYRTERFDRLQVGSKGLGRLAALRLGRVATITTRPRSEPALQHRLMLDWSRFEGVATVDMVDLEIDTEPTHGEPGTLIEVTDLRKPFSVAEATRIARALLLLSSPFDSIRAFVPSLASDEFASLERLVREGYWDQAAYEIRGSVDSTGAGTAEMVDHEREDRVIRATHGDLRGKEASELYRTPPATFELFVFKLNASNSAIRGKAAGISLGAIREWLKVVGGVHLFHRALRVFPYGDPGHDWLDMNLRRTASPEERPSTNTSVGRVMVLDDAGVLQQKTDRTGFIETPEFEDLRRFAQDVLEWAARVRLEEAEARRLRERRQASKSRERAQQQLQEVVDAVPPETRKLLVRPLRNLERATTREFDAVSGDLELYRTLATIGTTTAVMAHEATNPPNTIVKAAQSVRKRGLRLLPDKYENQLAEPVDLIESSARRLITLIELPRRLLDRGKRRRGTFDVNGVITESLALLSPLVDEHQVTVETSFDPLAPKYVGTVAALESIVANLIINAVNALNETKQSVRIVRVQTVVDGDRVVIDVADNGPGIRNIDLNDIWLPGRGTSQRGVGLGLTIVRDIAGDLGGTINADADGDLGGAQFTVRIPNAVD